MRADISSSTDENPSSLNYQLPGFVLAALALAYICSLGTLVRDINSWPDQATIASPFMSLLPIDPRDRSGSAQAAKENRSTITPFRFTTRPIDPLRDPLSVCGPDQLMDSKPPSLVTLNNRMRLRHDFWSDCQIQAIQEANTGKDALSASSQNTTNVVFSASHSFVTSRGAKIAYMVIMTLNENGTTFGPKVYMDAESRAELCAISPRDTETISAFRQSLIDALVQEAADPGRGLPSQIVDLSFASSWATNALTSIMGRCLLGNNASPGSLALDPALRALHSNSPRTQLALIKLPSSVTFFST